MDGQFMVSVVIPTYNRVELVQEAVLSILSQGIPQVQVIVVDDGSTDATREAIASMQSNWQGAIEYVFQENQGAAAARNKGLHLATGEFVGFLDSDDVWLPGKWKNESALFAADPSLGAIISDAETWVEGVCTVPSRFATTQLDPIPTHPIHFSWENRAWVQGSLCATCCMILRREVLMQLEPDWFDLALDQSEDWDFELRMYHATKVMINPVVLAQVRRFPDQTRIDRDKFGVSNGARQKQARYQSDLYVMQKFLTLPSLSSTAENLALRRVENLQSQLLALFEAAEELPNDQL